MIRLESYPHQRMSFPQPMAVIRAAKPLQASMGVEPAPSDPRRNRCYYLMPITHHQEWQERRRVAVASPSSCSRYANGAEMSDAAAAAAAALRMRELLTPSFATAKNFEGERPNAETVLSD